MKCRDADLRTGPEFFVARKELIHQNFRLTSPRLAARNHLVKRGPAEIQPKSKTREKIAAESKPERTAKKRVNVFHIAILAQRRGDLSVVQYLSVGFKGKSSPRTKADFVSE